MFTAFLIAAAGLACTLQPPAAPAPPAAKEPEAKARSVVEKLQGEAKGLMPLVKSDLAKQFLAATKNLPDVKTRTVYRNKERGIAVNAAEYAKLAPEKQADLKPRECTPEFYYYTGYGSPLVYARVVDLMAQHGVKGLGDANVLDFGYGTVGHLRLLSQMEANASGVDVEPLFQALYSEAVDWTIPLRSPKGETLIGLEHTIQLHTGQWPANAQLVKQVASGGPFNVITSKNTLKAGYIHPKPPEGKTVNEAQLVKLGVDDAAYLKAVHDSLKPGGLFIIYNICPAQSPEGDLTKPYIPWADGKSPFTKDQFASAGLEVIAFDVDDQAWVLDCWKALGTDQGKPRDEVAKDLFAWYTIARRKP
ncbi:MAG: hypothetical protein AABZ53_09040 [Planctomycetota bacterium]